MLGLSLVSGVSTAAPKRHRVHAGAVQVHAQGAMNVSTQRFEAE
jgi:hypothetical protein